MAVLISVIIPSYNDGHNVKRLVSQLPKNVEVIVVESGDSSYFRELSCKCFLTEKGKAQQMNFGAKHSKGNHLLFLHADSTLEGFDITLITKHLWGSSRIKFDNPKKYYRFIEWWSSLRARFLGPYGDQGIFMTRALFNAMGGFRSHTFEDMDMASRLSKIVPATILTQTITTSSRRFEKHGPVRTHMIMGGIHIMYLLGLLSFAKHLYTRIQ